jgi:uncharacterized phage protein (TIGR02220 family)
MRNQVSVLYTKNKTYRSIKSDNLENQVYGNSEQVHLVSTETKPLIQNESNDLESLTSPLVKKGPVTDDKVETNTNIRTQRVRTQKGVIPGENNLIIEEIVFYLNEALKPYRVKNGRGFSSKTPDTFRVIKKRMGPPDNFKIEDFKSVIDFKISEWGPKNEFRQYLRPCTLFGNKMESYVIQSQTKNADPLKIAFQKELSRV